MPLKTKKEDSRKKLLLRRSRYEEKTTRVRISKNLNDKLMILKKQLNLKSIHELISFLLNSNDSYEMKNYDLFQISEHDEPTESYDYFENEIDDMYSVKTVTQDMTHDHHHHENENETDICKEHGCKANEVHFKDLSKLESCKCTQQETTISSFVSNLDVHCHCASSKETCTKCD